MTRVCLTVEHGYPHRAGGVSEALHDLVRSLPDVRFSIVHLHDPADRPAGLAYSLPVNVDRVVTAAIGAGVTGLAPDADIYHAVSVGEASHLAATAARDRGVPFVLSEHGLAWHEAQIGIVGCKPFRIRPRPGQDVFGRLRGQLEEAYASADAITTVCMSNARRQVAWGAGRGNVHVIPNAVAPRPQDRRSGRTLTVGLVGRVVAVKDIATFLRACRLVSDVRDDIRFEVVGPLDHDPVYAEKCMALAQRLRLGDRLSFVGPQGRDSWPARLDIVVLTSISEGQPLVLLEAMAAGIPVVTTDVGGCRALVGGRHPAGLLTAPGNARATADSVLRLASDGELRARLAKAGRARTLMSHHPDLVARSHRRIYEQVQRKRR